MPFLLKELGILLPLFTLMNYYFLLYTILPSLSIGIYACIDIIALTFYKEKWTFFSLTKSRKVI